jgi:hypothetical protein
MATAWQKRKLRTRICRRPTGKFQFTCKTPELFIQPAHAEMSIYSIVAFQWEFYNPNFQSRSFGRQIKVLEMLLVASNKSRQLLQVAFIGQVSPEELQGALAEVTTELAGLSPGFHYLVDFSQFESMDLDGPPAVGQIMDLISRAGAGLVVRVIPDASRDIGMNILTIFHYPPELPVITCQTITEAVRALALGKTG